MKNLVCCIAMLLLATAAMSQTYTTVSGRVVDEKRLPLPGATVFLTGTKSITACDANGNFTLDRVSPGNYQVVVKMLGYTPYIKAIALFNQPLELRINLKPDGRELREVKIRPDYDRIKHLKIFIAQFMGQTANAKLSKILNPDDLYFTYDNAKHELNAVSDKILEIQNNGLGYKIKYVLTDFVYNDSSRVVSYQGYPSFTEMQGDAKQHALWDKNRRTAYLGSVNHFLRAVYAGDTHNQGYNVFKLLNRPIGGVQQAGAKQMILENDPISFDSLLTAPAKGLRTLKYTDCLYVVYRNEKEPAEFKDKSFNVKDVAQDDIYRKGQTSLIYLLTDGIDLDSKGLYNPVGGLFFEGYWAWEKNADLMPLEYTIDAGDEALN